MPAPRWLARTNRVTFNRVARHVAALAPGFGVVIHRGRRSGRIYRTPVNVFRRNGTYVVPLTYGPDSDWVKNVLAAGGGQLHTRGQRGVLTAPRLYRDKERSDMPGVVRALLGFAKVYDFLAFEVTDRPLSRDVARG